MFNRLERTLRHTGNPKDIELSRRISRLREQRGEDIPLETEQVDIKCFSDRANEAIERKRLYRYKPLTGQSIKTLRESGYNFKSTWHQHPAYRDVETLASRKTEVAGLGGWFLYDYTTLEGQLEMVAKLSTDLEYCDLQAIIGEAPDYIELACSQFALTGDSIFVSTANNISYASTVTSVDEFNPKPINISMFHEDGDTVIDVQKGNPNEKRRGLAVFPLIIPA